jgi:hypothetical protein
LRWEMLAALIGGAMIAGGLVVWPRLVLLCVGLLSLMLGLLSLVALKTISGPSLITVFAGIGLIGFGALVGRIEALLSEIRLRPDAARRAEAGEYLDWSDDRTDVRSFRMEGRVEPRLWVQSAATHEERILVSPAGSG